MEILRLSIWLSISCLERNVRRRNSRANGLRAFVYGSKL